MSEKKNLVIIILSCLLVASLCFIAYDKLLKKDTSTNKECVDNNNLVDNDSESDYDEFYNKMVDEIYYDDLLRHHLLYLENIYTDEDSNISDDEIQKFLYFYYYDYAFDNDLLKYEDDNSITYNINKKDIERVVLKNFGRKNFKIIDQSTGINEIRKIDENTYQLLIFPTGGFETIYKFKDVKKNDDDSLTQVVYDIYNDTSAGQGNELRGTATFYLDSSSGNTVITKVKTDLK